MGAGGRRGLGLRGRAALLQEGPGEVTTCHVSPDLRLAQTHSCGGNEYRGGSGPLHVTRYEARGQLDQAWLEAGQQAGDCTRGRCCPWLRVTCACPGYPLSEDLNGFQQEGVGKMDSTVHGGMRWSAASAYLRPALPRKVGVLVPRTS